MKITTYLPDCIGIVVLLVLVTILSSFVSSTHVPAMMWIPIGLAWAVAALFVWRKVGSSSKRWLGIAIISVVGAILWYLATKAIGHVIFGGGEPEVSKVFDTIVALVISPGLTFVAVAGWVRDIVLRRTPAESI